MQDPEAPYLQAPPVCHPEDEGIGPRARHQCRGKQPVGHSLSTYTPPGKAESGSCPGARESTTLHFVENFLGHTDSVRCRGPASVEGHMGNDGADFRLGHTVVQGTADMTA